MSNDRKTVSNDDYEISNIAIELSMPRFVIHLAKDKAKTTNRLAIQHWIEDHKFLIDYLMSDEIK